MSLNTRKVVSGAIHGTQNGRISRSTEQTSSKSGSKALHELNEKITLVKYPKNLASSREKLPEEDEYVGGHLVSAEAPEKGTFWGQVYRTMLPWVLNYEHHVVYVQKFFGVVYEPKNLAEKSLTPSGEDKDRQLHHEGQQNEYADIEPIITNPVADKVLRLVSELGNEVFLALWATINSTWFDYRIATEMVLLWSFSLYLGQFLKDSARLPRPGLRPGSPVARLEKHYQFEFGFPSTHMMLAVSQPILLIYNLLTEYEITSTPLFVGILAFSAFWAFGTPLSRLYLGVHSSLDVLSGFVLGIFSLIVVLLTRTLIGESFYTPIGALCIILVSITAMTFYPRPKTRWVNSPGDTAIVVGTTAGILLGYAFNLSVLVPMWGLSKGSRIETSTFVNEPLSQKGQQFVTYRRLTLPITTLHCFIAIARLLLTVVCIYIARLLVFKPLAIRVLRKTFGNEGPRKTLEEVAKLSGHLLATSYQIEVWEKLFGYGTMGFGATAVWTYVWDYIGLVYALPLKA